MKRQTVPRPGFPASPCIDICTLDENDHCLGCQRSVQEIVAWSRMSADEQWAVVNELPLRRRFGNGP